MKLRTQLLIPFVLFSLSRGHQGYVKEMQKRLRTWAQANNAKANAADERQEVLPEGLISSRTMTCIVSHTVAKLFQLMDAPDFEMAEQPFVVKQRQPSDASEFAGKMLFLDVSRLAHSKQIHALQELSVPFNQLCLHNGEGLTEKLPRKWCTVTNKVFGKQKRRVCVDFVKIFELLEKQKGDPDSKIVEVEDAELVHQFAQQHWKQFAWEVELMDPPKEEMDNLCSGEALADLAVLASTQKAAIQMALRKYLCDLMHQNEHEWTNGRARTGSEPTDSVEVEKRVMLFKRSDAKLPHAFESDFHFSVFFPSRFAALWRQFGFSLPWLLVQLTAGPFSGFDNPAKSASTFYTSADGHFFLKSVEREMQGSVKTMLLDVFANLRYDGEEWVADIERDFFFDEVQRWEKKNRRCVGDYLWSEKERKESSGFKGGVSEYFAHFEYKGHRVSTLLPRFFALFRFEPTQGQSTIFTVQNGLFPEGTPPVSYRFDLKGSSANRWLEEEEHRERDEDKRKRPLQKKTFKDLDLIRFDSGSGEAKGLFLQGILLDAETFERIQQAVEGDTMFLAEHNIIDYSLLLGVHFVGEEKPQLEASLTASFPAKCTQCCTPSEMVRMAEHNGVEVNKCGTPREHRLRIVVGIIDILQSFVVKKQAEFEYKSNNAKYNKLQFQAFPPRAESKQKHLSCTIIPPVLYRARFKDFLTSVVFRVEERMGSGKQ